jgi:hypothetical protein
VNGLPWQVECVGSAYISAEPVAGRTVSSEQCLGSMAVYATYRHIELDKIGYGKRR